MPKPTFFRLSDEKRQRLVQAGYAEFARAPFQTASISNIIRDAGIPRGSFYQYFEDKADIFFYLLDRTRTSTNHLYEQTLIAHDGDFFAALNDFFTQTAARLVTGPHADFYANVFLYMDFHSATHFTPAEKPPHGHEFVKLTLTTVDRSRLKVQSDAELRMLFRQAMWIFMQSIGYYYNRRKNGEAIPLASLTSRMTTMLNWLANGVAVSEEETHD